MPGASLDGVVVRPPDVIAVRVGDVMVLHDPRSDRYVRLNRTGELLWDYLSRGRSVRDMAAMLAARYGVPIARAQQDVQRLVGDLLARGLLESG